MSTCLTKEPSSLRLCRVTRVTLPAAQQQSCRFVSHGFQSNAHLKGTVSTASGDTKTNGVRCRPCVFLSIQQQQQWPSSTKRKSSTYLFREKAYLGVLFMGLCAWNRHATRVVRGSCNGFGSFDHSRESRRGIQIVINPLSLQCATDVCV